MDNNIEKILEKKYKIHLTDYAIYDVKEKNNNLFKWGIGIFVILVITLILLKTIFDVDISLIYILYGFFVFVMIPTALFKQEEYRALIVTKDALIQRTAKHTFSIIKYDDIIMFNLTENGIIIHSNNSLIVMSLKMPRSQMEPIIDILEAKGKTFESEKSYMVRPIDISFKNNRIIISDIAAEVSKDEMYEQFVGKYEFLTPGYLSEVILFDSIVTNVIDGKDHIEFKLNKFTVKDGHPENVHFDPIDVTDGCLILGKAKIERIVYTVYSDDDAEVEQIKPTFNNLQINVENGVISDWQDGFKKLTIDFAVGVHNLKVTIAYHTVIVGWNNVKS